MSAALNDHSQACPGLPPLCQLDRRWSQEQAEGNHELGTRGQGGEESAGQDGGGPRSVCPGWLSPLSSHAHARRESLSTVQNWLILASKSIWLQSHRPDLLLQRVQYTPRSLRPLLDQFQSVRFERLQQRLPHLGTRRRDDTARVDLPVEAEKRTDRDRLRINTVRTC